MYSGGCQLHLLLLLPVLLLLLSISFAITVSCSIIELLPSRHISWSWLCNPNRHRAVSCTTADTVWQSSAPCPQHTGQAPSCATCTHSHAHPLFGMCHSARLHMYQLLRQKAHYASHITCTIQLFRHKPVGLATVAVRCNVACVQYHTVCTKYNGTSDMPSRSVCCCCSCLQIKWPEP